MTEQIGLKSQLLRVDKQ